MALAATVGVCGLRRAAARRRGVRRVIAAGRRPRRRRDRTPTASAIGATLRVASERRTGGRCRTRRPGSSRGRSRRSPRAPAAARCGMGTAAVGFFSRGGPPRPQRAGGAAATHSPPAAPDLPRLRPAVDHKQRHRKRGRVKERPRERRRVSGRGNGAAPSRSCAPSPSSAGCRSPHPRPRERDGFSRPPGHLCPADHGPLDGTRRRWVPLG